MTEPLRSDPAVLADLAERDRDARVEELLVSGLDSYFSGQYELAINIWTRVLFIDRGHARARAYIERARGAVSERQREGDELVHAATAAIARGDAEAARRLLTAALERGAATEGAFALLERLQRLETAGVQPDARPPSPVLPVERRRGAPRAEASDHRLTWIAAGALLGMLGAAALMIWIGEGWFGGATTDAAAPARVEAPAVPVPTPGEIVLARARDLYQRGRLREALPALEAIPPGHPLRPQADELRATIQQQLLEARPRLPAVPSGPGGDR